MKWDKNKVMVKARDLEKKLGRRIVKRDNSNLFSLAKKHFGSWNNLMKTLGHEVREFRKVIIPFKYTKELFYFIGLLCSDGHIQTIESKGNYKLIIFTSYPEEKQIILKLMEKLFHYKASVREKNYGFSNKLNYEVHIYSKALCNFFIGFGIPSGNKSSIIKLPIILKKASRIEKISFLKGVFDGDGSIIRSKNQVIFRIYSGSRDFILGLKNLIDNLGFSPKINRERFSWSLSLNKQEEVKNLFKIFYETKDCCFYPRKKLKWKQQYI